MKTLLFYFQDLEMQKFTSRNVTLNNAIQNMDTNPIKTAITVCNNLIHRKVRLPNSIKMS